MSSDGLLSSTYESFCRKKGWDPRTLIVRGLKDLEAQLSEGSPALLMLDLPTSYGKTTITEALVIKAIEGNPIFSRVIHVLPMRSIADQLGHKIKEGLKNDFFNNKNIPLSKIEKTVGIQHLGLNDSPYFAKKVVITTLDTFVLNFYKAPVKEFSRVMEGIGTHFDFTRAQIYSALVVFDEFHLFSKMGVGREGSRERSKSLTSVMCAVKGLCLAGVPVIVMTATMPKVMKDFLINELGEYGIKVLDKTYRKGDDPNYEKRRGGRRISFSTLKINDLSGRCEDLISEGKKVLCVFNTVQDAVGAFRQLKHLNPFLIHGKLPEGVRKKRSEGISCGRNMAENTPKLAVSTQVIESGVDLSFDILITAPCPADRMMQRAGRVARAEGSEFGEVLVIENGGQDVSFGPYDPDLCVRSADIVTERNGLTREIVDEVYKDEPIEKDESLWMALSMLDNFVLLDSSHVEKALEHYRGFTDNFGIVTGFMESKVSSVDKRDYAVGLSENEARCILRTRRKVVEGNRVIDLKDNEFWRLINAPSVSLELQLSGYDGVAIEDFDPEIGYVRAEE